MDTNMLNIMEHALAIAEEEHDKASYLSESGTNAGIRKMNSNKADWLRWVVYLAQKGLEEEKRMSEPAKEESQDGGWMPSCKECLVSTESKKLIAAKDEIIEDLTQKLKSLQFTYDCEVEYRKAFINKAIIDYADKASKTAHDNCWLDGTFLVTPVEHLDRALLELIKE